jgi:MoxR-like ATPase
LHDRTVLVAPLITAEAVAGMAELAAGVHVQPNVLRYVTELAEETRERNELRLGVSVRGCLALVRAAKARAAADGRNHVIPDDVVQLAEPVLAHRLALEPEAEFSGKTTANVLAEVLADIRPPADRVMSY